MSANAANLYGKQYANSVALLLQQKGSRFEGAVTTGQYQGSQASPVDQIGAVEMQQVTTRFGAIGRVDAALSRRWVNPTDWDLPQLMDSFDELKILSNPKSKYVLNAIYAAGRKKDDLIIDAFFGNASTGVDGSTSTSFATDGGNTVAVDEAASAANNMTVAKLRRARRYLLAAEVDMEMDSLHGAMNAQADDSLLQEAQVVSTDFNERPVLVDGKIVKFLGFQFIHSERLDTDGNSYRQCPFWAKSGMHSGMWTDMQTDISQRKDLSGLPWQAYLKISLGATRLEGAKVVEVLCSET